MTAFDIYNPATARRIIHSGVAGAKPIEILPRQIVQNVELQDHIAEDLMLRHSRDPDNELRLEIVSDEPQQKAPAMKITIDESKVTVVKGKR